MFTTFNVVAVEVGCLHCCHLMVTFSCVRFAVDVRVISKCLVTSVNLAGLLQRPRIFLFYFVADGFVWYRSYKAFDVEALPCFIIKFWVGLSG